MSRWRFAREPRLRLGTALGGFLPRPLRLSLTQLRTSWHIIGLSGSGKSRFLSHLVLSLLDCGEAVTLLDVHGDLARLVLAQLVARGTFRDEAAFERIRYLDLPAAERANRYLPLNTLAGHGSPHTRAANVKEAFHRAYPELASGAPMFDTLVQDSCKLLISASLPITALFRTLTDRTFRETLLAGEEDQTVVAFFRGQFDRLSPRDQADQAGAALRRAHLLTFAPVLRHSLGQTENALDFRRLMDTGTSLIVNLALLDREARRLLGCLLTVAAETGALSRAELPASQRLRPMHLCIDEFAEFAASSEESLSALLSQCKKFCLHLVLVHQNWSQASERLRGSMQNVGLEVCFTLGRSDAENSARRFGHVTPKTVRQTVSAGESESAGMAEQREQFTQALETLPQGHAYLLPRGQLPVRFRTPHLPDPPVDPDLLAAVEARYLARYFRPPVVERPITVFNEDRERL